MGNGTTHLFRMNSVSISEELSTKVSIRIKVFALITLRYMNQTVICGHREDPFNPANYDRFSKTVKYSDTILGVDFYEKLLSFLDACCLIQ
jgi:hypothetical protein